MARHIWLANFKTSVCLAAISWRIRIISGWLGIVIGLLKMPLTIRTSVTRTLESEPIFTREMRPNFHSFAGKLSCRMTTRSSIAKSPWEHFYLLRLWSSNKSIQQRLNKWWRTFNFGHLLADIHARDAFELPFFCRQVIMPNDDKIVNCKIALGTFLYVALMEFNQVLPETRKQMVKNL